MTRHPDFCFSREASCIPNKFNFPTVPKNNNVYKIIKARSWWFCGKIKITGPTKFSVYSLSGMACDPTTPCKYWTYRHAHRTCYLLKSCCFSEGKNPVLKGIVSLHIRNICKVTSPSSPELLDVPKDLKDIEHFKTE